VEKVARRGAFNRFVWHAAGPVALGRDAMLALRPQASLAADLDWLYGHDAGAV
jgi:salicylate hydroxylase